MKHLSLFLCSMLFVLFIQAQSPVGKWKYAVMYTETNKGQKTDLLNWSDVNNKDRDCQASVVYFFQSDGKITFDADKSKCSGTEKAPGVKWTSPAKNKINMYIDEDDDSDVQTFDVQFIDNKMRMTMDFKDKSPDAIRYFVIEFVKA